MKSAVGVGFLALGSSFGAPSQAAKAQWSPLGSTVVPDHSGGSRVGIEPTSLEPGAGALGPSARIVEEARVRTLDAPVADATDRLRVVGRQVGSAPDGVSSEEVFG